MREIIGGFVNYKDDLVSLEIINIWIILVIFLLVI